VTTRRSRARRAPCHRAFRPTRAYPRFSTTSADANSRAGVPLIESLCASSSASWSWERRLAARPACPPHWLREPTCEHNPIRPLPYSRSLRAIREPAIVLAGSLVAMVATAEATGGSSATHDSRSEGAGRCRRQFSQDNRAVTRCIDERPRDRLISPEAVTQTREGSHSQLSETVC